MNIFQISNIYISSHNNHIFRLINKKNNISIVVNYFLFNKCVSLIYLKFTLCAYK